MHNDVFLYYIIIGTDIIIKTDNLTVSCFITVYFIFRLILNVRTFFWLLCSAVTFVAFMFPSLTLMVFVFGGILGIYVPGYCYFELFLLIFFYNASW